MNFWIHYHPVYRNLTLSNKLVLSPTQKVLLISFQIISVSGHLSQFLIAPHVFPNARKRKFNIDNCYMSIMKFF